MHAQHQHDRVALPSGGNGATAGSAAARSQRPLAIVLALTSVFLVAELITAYVTNSLALLADAAHMLTDVVGLLLAFAAIRVAQKPATAARTYGFYRVEILAALANAGLLLLIAIYILFEASRRLWQPVEIHSLPMILVAIVGLGVNLIAMRLLHSGASESLTIQGAFLEVVADLLASVGVLIAAAIILLTGWWVADLVVSVFIGVLILPRAWKLAWSALNVLLEAAPAHINLAELEASMRAVPGVVAVHDLHVWTITSGFVALSAHIQAAGRRSEDVLHELQSTLRQRFGIEHSTLQVESPDHADDGACCVLDPRCLILGSSLPSHR